jgi:type IV pilus assembly protein PilY1
MYVGDTSAQVWRFDVSNGNPVGTLVAGGVIASLGTREDTVRRATATRRFYSMPDVALITPPGRPAYLNVAIGSGYRGHPLDKTVRDRFYSVRDVIAPLSNLSQATFNSITALALIRDSEITSTRSLVDITSTVAPILPLGAAGWQLQLDTGVTANGEKALSPSTTFNNEIIFTTYTPTSVAPTDACAGVGSGTNRVYFVSVADGSPADDLNKDTVLTTSDRHRDLAQSGIAPQIQFLFLPTSTGTEVDMLSGVEMVNRGNLNQRVKTYWREGQAR